MFDFADHVTRNETYFRDVWFRWLLFTICSTLAVYGWLYTLNVLTVRLTKHENLIQQTVVIFIALLLHQYVSGPLFDWIISGQSTLSFTFNATILIIFLGIFYVIRLILFFLTRRTKVSTN